MPTTAHKNRKKRGHVSAGHGRVGKHRSHPGGRGNAGGQHHHRTLMDKYHPGYFGKIGMRTFHRKPCTVHSKSINVDKLWALVGGVQQPQGGAACVINVSSAGYFKVLGKGRIPDVPMVVKARLFSQEAEKKIVAAGGACVLTAE